MDPVEFGMASPTVDEEAASGTPLPSTSEEIEMVPLLPTSLLDNNDADDVSRRPPTELSDNDDTFSVMPWWPVDGAGDPVACYHTNTRKG